jgi:hypothetical protein
MCNNGCVSVEVRYNTSIETQTKGHMPSNNLHAQLECAAQKAILLNCTPEQRAIVAQAALIMHDTTLAQALLGQHSTELRVITRAALQQMVTERKAQFA